MRFDTAVGAALLEREDALPVVLPADHSPAALLWLVVESLGEGADFGIGQALCRTVGVLTLHVVVQHQHHQPCAVLNAPASGSRRGAPQESAG